MRLAIFFADVGQLLRRCIDQFFGLFPFGEYSTLNDEDTVEDRLRRAFGAGSANRERDDVAKAYVAAVNVIDHFLGRDFCERYIKLRKEADPYMLNNFSLKSQTRFLYQDRVIKLADYLFTLRNEKGFNNLLRRFTDKRDMRSVNLEAMISSHFKRRRFSVEILPTTYVRGQDFDFVATRGTETINVEVTGCTNEGFRAKTIKRKLEEKRDQSAGYGAGNIVLDYSAKMDGIPKSANRSRENNNSFLWQYKKTQCGCIRNAYNGNYRKCRLISEYLFPCV